AAANVETTIMNALKIQYADVLTPLKDSIPKRLRVSTQFTSARDFVLWLWTAHKEIRSISWNTRVRHASKVHMDSQKTDKEIHDRLFDSDGERIDEGVLSQFEKEVKECIKVTRQMIAEAKELSDNQQNLFIIFRI
ncbi:hypothetical protein Tco_0199671, partial [Tanacetum coccineum]